MTTRSIRLFLSSTFRDFGEERDLLVKRVFLSLRAKLKDRLVELVDVDLRWGIKVEEAERGEVLPICLAEIDRAMPYGDRMTEFTVRLRRNWTSARVKVVVASFMQPAFEYRYQSNAS